MSTPVDHDDEVTREHPISRFTNAVLDAIVCVADAPAWSMSPDDQRRTLVELDRVESKISELRLRVLAEADRARVGDDTGASSTAAWLSRTTRQTRAHTGADVRLAQALDARFESTRQALRDGRLNVDQARAIVSCVDQLPDDVGPVWRERAESHLVEQAAHVDARTLRILGRRIFDVLDPDAADEREGRKLEEEERRAREHTRFAMRDNGDGTHSGTFKIPDLHAAILRKALESLAAPRRVGKERFDPESGRKRPYPTVLGQAFCDLLERLPKDRLPVTAGGDATVVVTIDHDLLLRGIGAAVLDDGTRISASEARRLACEARIIPVVLGGDSVPLDIGRERRLYDRHQRIAMATRDTGCTAVGCDRPPSWCEAHHDLPWSEGGPTDLAQGRLLCFHHHRLAHDDGFVKTRLPDGRVRFNRRQ